MVGDVGATTLHDASGTTEHAVPSRCTRCTRCRRSTPWPWSRRRRVACRSGSLHPTG